MLQEAFSKVYFHLFSMLVVFSLFTLWGSLRHDCGNVNLLHQTSMLRPCCICTEPRASPRTIWPCAWSLRPSRHPTPTRCQVASAIVRTRAEYWKCQYVWKKIQMWSLKVPRPQTSETQPIPTTTELPLPLSSPTYHILSLSIADFTNVSFWRLWSFVGWQQLGPGLYVRRRHVWWHYCVQSGFSVQPNWNIQAATQVTSSGYSHRLRSMEYVFASAKNVHIPPTPQTPESKCVASSMYARTKIVNIPPPTINPISCVAWSMCLQVQATLTSSHTPPDPYPSCQHIICAHGTHKRLQMLRLHHEFVWCIPREAAKWIRKAWPPCVVRWRT